MGLIDIFLDYAERKVSQPSAASNWIIEYNGKYWTGYKFIKDKSTAQGFASKSAAWNYVNDTFSNDVGEDCSLVRR